MKLNNKGFGMRETLVYLSILLMVLLIASCSISSFYNDLENGSDDNDYSYLDNIDESNDEVINEEEEIEINYTSYYLAEAKFREAAKNYAYDYNLSDSLNTVSLSDVYNAGYLSNKIVDVVDGSECSGYANIEFRNVYGGVYDIDAYISCTNYKTEGYR